MKHTMNKLALAVSLITISAFTHADVSAVEKLTTGGLTSFANGTPADATKVNANFNAITAAVIEESGKSKLAAITLNEVKSSIPADLAARLTAVETATTGSENGAAASAAAAAASATTAENNAFIARSVETNVRAASDQVNAAKIATLEAAARVTADAELVVFTAGQISNITDDLMDQVGAVEDRVSDLEAANEVDLSTTCYVISGTATKLSSVTTAAGPLNLPPASSAASIQLSSYSGSVEMYGDGTALFSIAETYAKANTDTGKFETNNAIDQGSKTDHLVTFTTNFSMNYLVDVESNAVSFTPKTGSSAIGNAPVFTLHDGGKSISLTQQSTVITSPTQFSVQQVNGRSVPCNSIGN